MENDDLNFMQEEEANKFFKLIFIGKFFKKTHFHSMRN